MLVHNQVSVADRLVSNGDLQDSVEDQSPAAGTATVEAEYELVKVRRQVCFVDRSLVGAEQPRLVSPDTRWTPGSNP